MYSCKKNINRNTVACVRCDYCGYSRSGWKDNVKIYFREIVSVIQKEMNKFGLGIDNIIIYILRGSWAHTYLFVCLLSVSIRS